LDEVRGFMLAQLEATLDLLDQTEESDEALHLFRAMLFYEDLRGEQLVSQAQALGLRLPYEPAPALTPRPPLHLPATRWRLGAAAGGFAPSLDRPNQTVEVPEFEIDAQPVTWSQFIEFVDDGGYDRPELWHSLGWEWLQRVVVTEGRRGPRHVEQIGVSSGAVIQSWFGRPIRLSGMQPVVHVTWWEADAWARWAGRRLPSEAEWEIAAHHAMSRGFRWGSVLEWVAGSLLPWPGYVLDDWLTATPFDPQQHWGKAKVQRGGSMAMRARMKSPRARRFSRPEDDLAFNGFRTCAV
jgi:formylglycine-generating enzyme required for sulfatase activity